MARRFSRSAADADDAYQRALEKLLLKPPTLAPGESPLPWLLTVVRNEALMIVRGESKRSREPFEEIARQMVGDCAIPEERIVEGESADAGREALLRISPDQARCLLLRADGMSYDEISEATGFSFSKVHRSLHDGRRVYRGLLRRIEAGDECRRLEPLISKFVDGEADEAERRDVQLHAENCLGCRATIRDFGTAPRAIAGALPLAIETGAGWLQRLGQWIDGQWAHLVAWGNERAFTHVGSGQLGELAAAKKFALAAAAAGTLVAGGVSVERVVADQPRFPSPAGSRLPDAIGKPSPGQPAKRHSDAGGRGADRKAARRAKPVDATEADVIGNTRSHKPPEAKPTGNSRVRTAPSNPAPSTTPSPDSDLPDDAVREDVPEGAAE